VGFGSLEGEEVRGRMRSVQGLQSRTNIEDRMWRIRWMMWLSVFCGLIDAHWDDSVFRHESVQ